jgi:hypothetical protein
VVMSANHFGIGVEWTSAKQRHQVAGGRKRR